MDAEWVSAVTALVAVVVGPFVGVYVARRQIQLTAISANRCEWIKQLRELTAQLVAECRFFGIEFMAGAETMDKEKAIGGLQRIFLLEQQIVLMLDPQETEHKELIALVRNASGTIGAFDKERVKAIRLHGQAVLAMAQSILKKEWEALKAGE